MFGLNLTESLQITADTFENSLASDDLLTHYFNDFLRLPSFPVALLYNRGTRLFEVVSEGAEPVSRRLRSDLHRGRVKLLTGDPTTLARTPPIHSHYTVCCLDREQGIQWILRERFPFFLQSECYSEYRLAKLLFLWDPNKCIQGRKESSGHMTLEYMRTRRAPTHSVKQASVRMNITCLPSEQKEILTFKHSQLYRCFSSFCEPEQPCALCLLSSSLNHKRSSQFFKTPSAGNSEEQQPEENESHGKNSCEHKLKSMAAEVVQQVLNNSMEVVNGRSQMNFSDCLWSSQHQGECSSTDELCECKVCQLDRRGKRLEDNNDELQQGQRESREGGKKELFKTNGEGGSWCADQENVPDICCHGPCCHGTRPGLEEFRDFLQGTPGEKLLNLWIDIERLKATQNNERKSRYLSVMRSCYLHSSSQRSLNVELLARMGLSTSPCWTDEKMLSIQPFLIDSLLNYWIPRYWTSRYVRKEHEDFLPVERRIEFSKIPPSSIQPHSDCPNSTLPHSLLQTQLWENAVNFWTDLQQYRGLFCLDGPDPYRVQREAQLLYSTYLCCSARRSVGVNEETRKEVYSHMILLHGELFDKVEEHVLNILLEPWSLLGSREKESFQKVEKHGDPSLMNPHMPSSQGPRGSGFWPRVSPKNRSYHLGSSLFHHHELGYFMSFLQNHNASIHLTCWLDLEQYMGTPLKDEDVRQERSSQIVTKYLSEKYFFGSDSPATAEQQDYILHLAGGLERFKFENLSNKIVEEIQDVIRSHIEEKWLPLFLSTAEFTERQKQRGKPHSADQLLLKSHRQRRTRRKPWKAGNLWMISSIEILLFRRLLLNPVTCLQFQHFISLKGDLLENNLLFWLEVQRYKDLCHSNSNEETIQEKISTIISCFIDSSIPPALQIDISPEQARHILEKQSELSPCIFRQAQTTVFSELLKFWPEFQELSSSVRQEKLLPLLQEKKAAHRVSDRRLRRKEDENDEEVRRAQAELERSDSRFQEEEETEAGEQEYRPEKSPATGGLMKSPADLSGIFWTVGGSSWREVPGESVHGLENTATPRRKDHLAGFTGLEVHGISEERGVLLRKRSKLKAAFSTGSDSSSHNNIS